jgi:hypothetical protein
MLCCVGKENGVQFSMVIGPGIGSQYMLSYSFMGWKLDLQWIEICVQNCKNKECEIFHFIFKCH